MRNHRFDLSHGRPRRLWSTVVAAATVVVLPAALAAQEGPPALPDASSKAALATDGQPKEQPPIPGLGQADFRIRPAPLVQEGTFLTRRPGRMVRLPAGEWAFVFHPDERGLALRPMVLIPSLALQRMEQAVEDRTVTFLVTGEVFMYMGVNYLLPDTFSIVAPDGPELRPRPADPAPPLGPDPAVEDLVRELEQQRQRPRVIDPGTPLPRAQTPPYETRAPAAAHDGLIPDMQRLERRRGRMIRMAGSEWAVAFDNGPQHEPGLDRPLILVPSLNLQRMQGWASRMGDSAPLEVSGRVLQYRGRNYLIPTLYRMNPALTPLEPIQ